MCLTFFGRQNYSGGSQKGCLNSWVRNGSAFMRRAPCAAPTLGMAYTICSCRQALSFGRSADTSRSPTVSLHMVLVSLDGPKRMPNPVDRFFANDDWIGNIWRWPVRVSLRQPCCWIPGNRCRYGAKRALTAENQPGKSATN